MIPVARIRKLAREEAYTAVYDLAGDLLAELPPDGVVLSGDEVAGMREGLEKLRAQADALRIVRENNFVFEDRGREPGSWQHLAFTLYMKLCAIEYAASVALALLDSEEEA